MGDWPVEENFDRAVRTLERAEGKADYWFWPPGMDIVPDGAGAFAVNKPVRDEHVQEMIDVGVFCLTGDTTIVAPPTEKSYKRLYSGEIVAIETASGKKLTGTPNHPVLTDKGWLPLKSLRKGGYVVSSPGFGQLAGSDPDYYQEPTCFEDMHRSLADAGYVDQHAVAPLDFHGDGRDGEVEVVVPEGILRDRLESSVDEEGFEFGFSDATLPDAAFAVSGTPNKEATGIGFLTRFVGGTHLGESSVGGKVGILEALSFGGGSQRDARFPESDFHRLSRNSKFGGYGPVGFPAQVLANDGSGIEIEPPMGDAGRGLAPVELGGLSDTATLDPGLIEPFLHARSGHAEAPGYLGRTLSSEISRDEVVGSNILSPLGFGSYSMQAIDFASGAETPPGFHEPPFNRARRYTKPLGDRLEGLPADVRLDKIISVDVRTFEGHVYNLQTEPGHYIANGILSHNCQGIINYIRRFNSKIVPTMGDSRYDGGTWANQNYFRDFAHPFNRYVSIPRGALIGRNFRWAGAPGFSAVVDQGHVGVLVEAQDLKNQQGGILLHSHPAVGGLNRTKLGDSHAGWYYQYWIHPRDWINHDVGRFG